MECNNQLIQITKLERLLNEENNMDGIQKEIIQE